jgi:hypothetical protein
MMEALPDLGGAFYIRCLLVGVRSFNQATGMNIDKIKSGKLRLAL